MNNLLEQLLQYVTQPWRLVVPLKRLAIFLLLLGLAIAGYYWAIENFRAGQYITLSVVIFWLATAYYLLPRVHRFLSKIYVPDYFFGRARTADGLLADPVNLAIRGSKKDLVRAMHSAGWAEADPITLKTALRIISSTLRKKSYPSAPVSDLFVFEKKHDLAFQKEVNGNPAKRHHVRFWKMPTDTYLPGGFTVDWVAAATHDDAVGVSLFTLQITHSIDGDVDAERDFLVTTLQESKHTLRVKRIENFFPQYRHRNGGGHKYFTDGSMVIVDLKKGRAT